MKPGMDAVTFFSVAMFTMKKNRAMKIGGITDSSVARHGPQGPAGDGGQVVDEAGRSGPDPLADASKRRLGGNGHRAVLLLVVLLDMAAGQVEEHVVERRGAQGQVPHRHLAPRPAPPRSG